MDTNFQTIHAGNFDFRWTSDFEPLPMELHGFIPHYRSGVMQSKGQEFQLDLVNCDGHWAIWMLSDSKALIDEARHYHGFLSLTPQMTHFLWPQIKEMLCRAGYPVKISEEIKEPIKVPWMFFIEPLGQNDDLNSKMLSDAIRGCSSRLAFFLSNGKFRPI